jgi:hypothetical protein
MLDPPSFDDLQAERYDEDEYRNDAYGPHGDVYPSWPDLILLVRNPSGSFHVRRLRPKLRWRGHQCAVRTVSRLSRSSVSES